MGRQQRERARGREIQETRCTCGMLLWDRNTPCPVEENDYFVCIYCGQVMQLDATLRGKPIDLHDVPHAATRNELREMQEAAAEVGPVLRERHKHRRPNPLA